MPDLQRRPAFPRGYTPPVRQGNGTLKTMRDVEIGILASRPRFAGNDARFHDGDIRSYGEQGSQLLVTIASLCGFVLFAIALGGSALMAVAHVVNVVLTYASWADVTEALRDGLKGLAYLHQHDPSMTWAAVSLAVIVPAGLLARHAAMDFFQGESQ